MAEQRQILVIDDEQIMRDGCTRILSEHGWSVLPAEDGSAGLADASGIARGDRSHPPGPDDARDERHGGPGTGSGAGRHPAGHHHHRVCHGGIGRGGDEERGVRFHRQALHPRSAPHRRQAGPRTKDAPAGGRIPPQRAGTIAQGRGDGKIAGQHHHQLHGRRHPRLRPGQLHRPGEPGGRPHAPAPRIAASRSLGIAGRPPPGTREDDRSEPQRRGRRHHVDHPGTGRRR